MPTTQPSPAAGRPPVPATGRAAAFGRLLDSVADMCEQERPADSALQGPARRLAAALDRLLGPVRP